jgi:ABC-type Fe3+-siderophore transport system permease subunit
MQPEAQIVVFALVSLLFFMISLFADNEDWLASAGCTGALVAYWALNTILWMTGYVEDWSLPSDIFFALVTVALAFALRRGWLVALAGLFLVNLVLDGLHLAGLIGYGSWAEAGNVTFVLQLGTASFPGLVRVTRGLVGRLKHRET